MFFSVSCVLEKPELAEFDADDTEIIKAKEWFESKNFGVQNGVSITGRASNGQSTYNDKRPDWSQVKKHTNVEGEKVIEVSLDFEKSLIPKHLIEIFRSKKPSPQQIAQNLLLIEKDDGTFKALVLKIYAESDLSANNKRAFFNKVNYGKTPANFTGEMIMTDMEENIIRGWRIQNGKIISRFKPVVETKKKKGTENQSITCNFEEVDYCEVTSGWFIDPIEGLQYGAELHCYKNNIVVCIKTDADGDNGGGSPISDDPGSGGGGNDGDGGGGDSNCFKQDPYFEDLWIPCDDDLVLDDQIDMEELTDCHKGIINNLIGSTQQEFKRIFEKFNGNQPVPLNYNVKFKYGVCTNPSATACTSSTLVNGWATITLNSGNLNNSTDLSFARTVLHETLHAYLLFEAQYPSNCDLNCLLNDYLSRYNSNNHNNITHHALFAETKFLNDIAVELKNYGLGNGYILDDQFYKDMAWGGLTRTEVFLEGKEKNDRDRIIEVNWVENTVSNQYNISPKGEKACD